MTQALERVHPVGTMVENSNNRHAVPIHIVEEVVRASTAHTNWRSHLKPLGTGERPLRDATKLIEDGGDVLVGLGLTVVESTKQMHLGQIALSFR